MNAFGKAHTSFKKRSIAALAILAFMVTSILPPDVAALTISSSLQLPPVGTMVSTTKGYQPTLVQGISINPQDPLNFTFYVSPGDDNLDEAALRETSDKLIKYFLASLTTPSSDLWVNLSPHEKDKIISEKFGVTEMGRDLLAQDYILKQLTASLMYPEDELGKKFWQRVHAKAAEKFGTTQIPMNAYHKIWIVPERAAVYENESGAFVVNSRLKVMLAEDYVAMQQAAGRVNYAGAQSDNGEHNALVSQIIREVLVPEIEKEVNEGETFANLRQVYHSMILASWFKNSLRESLLGQVYVDQAKVSGVDADDPQVKEKIYDQYLQAFKKGVYNYIKEEYDPVTEEVLPRQYFSGGAGFQRIDSAVMGETYTNSNLRSAPVEVLRGMQNIAADEAIIAVDVDLYEADRRGKNATVIAQAISEALADFAMTSEEGDKAKTVPVDALDALKERGLLEAANRRVRAIAKTLGDTVAQGYLDPKLNTEQADAKKQMVSDIAVQLEEIHRNIKAGLANPARVASVRTSLKDADLPEDLPEEVVRVVFHPGKDNPRHLGHLWVALAAMAKLQADVVLTGVDDSDPTRKSLPTLTVREAISRVIHEQYGGLVQYSPIFRDSEEYSDKDGEYTFFGLMEMNRHAKQGFMGVYVAGSDHANSTAQKLNKLNNEVMPDTPIKLRNFMLQGLIKAIKDAGYAEDIVLTHLFRNNYFGMDLGLTDAFGGFSTDLKNQMRSVYPEMLAGDGFIDPKWMRELQDAGIIDTKGKLIKFGEELQRDLETMLRDIIEDTPELRKLNDAGQEALKERFKYHVLMAERGSKLTDADFDTLSRIVIANKTKPGLKGFIPGGNQSVVVLISQRIGEEINPQQLRALRILSGLRIETVDQPMETSSTDVREGRGDSSLEKTALDLMQRFKVYGFASEENDAIQAQVVDKALNMLRKQIPSGQGATVQAAFVNELKQLDINGQGFEILDGDIMRQISEVNAQLKGELEEEAAASLASRKKWLLSVRETLFARAYQLAADYAMTSEEGEAKTVPVDALDALKERGLLEAANRRVRAIAKTLGDTVAQGYLDPKLNTEQADAKKQMVNDIAVQLEEIYRNIRAGLANPARVASVRTSLKDADLPEDLPEEVVRVVFHPGKDNPRHLGHLWVALAAMAKLQADVVLTGVDDSDPTRKSLPTLTVREAISRVIHEQYGGLVQYSPIFRDSEEYSDKDGEYTFFGLMEMNRHAKQGFMGVYVAGSDHANSTAQKLNKLNNEVMPDTPIKLRNFMLQGLIKAIKDAGYAEDIVLTHLFRNNYFGMDLGLTDAFGGFSTDLKNQMRSVYPEMLAGDGFIDPKWMRELQDAGIIDTKGKLIKFGEELQRDLETMLRDIIEDTPELRKLNDAGQEALKERFKYHVLMAERGSKLTDADFDTLSRIVIANKTKPGLKGFIPGGNQSVVVLISQRIGEEINPQQLRALRILSGLRIETVDQPMETSSTDVREGRGDSSLEKTALDLMQRFKVYGFASEENDAIQAQVVDKALNMLRKQIPSGQGATVQAAFVNELKQLDINGQGFEILDGDIMRQISEVNAQLKGELEEEAAASLASRKKWLLSVRETLFARAYQIARGQGPALAIRSSGLPEDLTVKGDLLQPRRQLDDDSAMLVSETGIMQWATDRFRNPVHAVLQPAARQLREEGVVDVTKLGSVSEAEARRVIGRIIGAEISEDGIATFTDAAEARFLGMYKEGAPAPQQDLAAVLGQIIKEYDIRGYDGFGDPTANPQHYDEDLLRWIGRTMATVEFESQVHRGKRVKLEPGDSFVIAGDNGPSTQWVKDNLIAGLREAGINVIDLGGSQEGETTVISGQLYKSISTLGAKGGLYVTRSHVEIGTNGMKPNIGGITLYGDMLTGIKEQILSGEYVRAETPGDLNTSAEIRQQSREAYYKSLRDEYKGLREAISASGLKVALNFNGGSSVDYRDIAEELVGTDNITRIIRDKSDPLNKNGGLADPSRDDDTALAHPKENVIQYSKENPNEFIISFDLDTDRVSIVMDGELYLGDRMFYPIVEHLLTLDEYSEIHKTQPIWVDSRMRKEVGLLARFFGGIAKKHPKGHSKVKATMDMQLLELAESKGFETIQDFLAAFPGYKDVQAEYSLHMFKTDQKGQAFDDALDFGLYWLQVYTQLMTEHRKDGHEWAQTGRFDAYIDHLVSIGAFQISEQLKEQRTPSTDDAKTKVMIAMKDAVVEALADKDDFSYEDNWRTADSDTPILLVNIDGVFDLTTPKGNIFWGWSNTSPKVAYGVQSDTNEDTVKLTEAVTALYIHSRTKLDSGLPQIDDKETTALRDLLGEASSVDVEARVLAKYPTIESAIAGLTDQAITVTQKPETTGGIDLNPELLDLQIKRDGNGVALPVLMQPIETLQNIDGFIPVIIQMTPITNMPLILGYAPDADPQQVGYENDLQGTDPRARMEDVQEEGVDYLS